jgi:hypothetical protein
MEISLNFDNYLFRCSSLGKLMVGVKDKLTEKQTIEMDRLLGLRNIGKISDKQTITLGQFLEKRDSVPELSATTKNYLQELHLEVLFKRSNELRSKYLDKGIQVEQKSLTLYSQTSGKPFYKNKQRFNNEFITGEPDNVSGIVRDIKSSWDFSTFPFYDTSVPNSIYEWQLLGYMALTNLKEAELVYCLVDTPFKIIDDEVRRLDWKENVMTNEGDIKKDKQQLVVELVSSKLYTLKGLEEFCQQSSNINVEWFTNFREVPEDLRVKAFTVSADEEKIKSLYAQIEKCREYLNDLSLQVAERLEVTTEVA